MHGWIAALLDRLGLGASGSTVEPPGVPAGRWRCPPGVRVWKCPPGARSFVAPPAARSWKVDPMATFAGVVEKTPGGRLWLTFNFGDLPEIRKGATIATYTIPAVTGITIAGVAPLANGYEIGAWYSGGADAGDYDVKCTITLSDTTVEEKTGTLQVRTKSL